MTSSITPDTASSIKVRENRLRRKAKRQGLTLVKSRLRDPDAIGYGGWVIAQDGWAVVGDFGFSALDLDDVEQYLTGGDDD
ncbi:hypothetical protein ACIOD2_27330 [Amycolatopsis sp. NPDC088138]|uniref:hypothetical protein n=1 Tax=Amycolatopsis sp. NPDC088138 TaxID=3363938 RepID=UPI003830D5CA